MAKHTPGPWHVGVRQAHRIIYDTKGWAVADATVYHGKESHDEMMANARLIAEAPAMLEALRAFVESAEEGGMCSVCGAEPRGDKRIGTFIPRCPSWCVAESARAILARIDGPTGLREKLTR